ncbi:MAG TPA: SDR family oxidoreductase [Flavobacterium sp.]|jgi:NAD(P)-dependent dehydrogenase (short-subunit alcohol dehydrogenase family)
MDNNKIALITGGSRGLGKDMAFNLAKRGTDVIFTYNNRKDEAQEVVRQLENLGVKAATLQLDVADSKKFSSFINEVQALLKNTFEARHIDFLINNAGVGHHKPFAETTEEDFDNMVNIHLKATYFLTQKALPILEDGGAIINLSSGLARFSTPGHSAYASMKGGIETLTRYMAKELGNRQIRVNTVAPGAIETDFGGGAVRDNAEMNAMIASGTALGRVGKADDIGSVVAFLCSDEAKWINGQRIEISGGVFL